MPAAPASFPRQIPIKRQLIGGTLLNTLSVLLLTCVALLAYEIHRDRDATVTSLSTIANIVADNASAVLLYDDQQSAGELLAGLHFEPGISAAALFDAQGGPFASYHRAAAERRKIPALPPPGVVMHATFFTLSIPVVQGPRHVGVFFLEGDLSETYRRSGVYALVLLTVLSGSGVVAMLLSNFFQRRISEPLLELASTARAISERKDYSVRAVQRSNDEIGDLTRAFNAMLEQIQQTEAALREGEERFRALADNIPQLAWMATGIAHATWFNQRWYDYTGTTFAEVHGRGWERVQHPDHLTRVSAKIADCFARGVAWEDTFPIRGRDGQYRWFLSAASPIRDTAGNVRLWFGTNTDITEQREAEQRALAASSAKDDFLAALSHELRNPLNPVLLVAGESSQDPALPPEVRSDFELIRKNVELEARLIDDLLDLTSITRGKLVLNTQAVDVNQVVLDAVATVRGAVEEKQIELELSLDRGAPQVEGDAVRLQQVFWNILKNAAKFTPAHGQISVTTRRLDSGKICRIQILDTGIGLSDSELARIFEAFSQGDHAGPAGSHRFGGLGLGLTISRMLVERHGGCIMAASEGRDRGALFTIELPLRTPATFAHSPVPAAVIANRASAARTHAPSRILLVEDHDATRQSLERFLKRRGFDVAAAASVAQAEALADRGTFDVVVSDIGLPDGTGYDLMEKLRGRYGLLGIALTGFGMEADLARSRSTGFIVHLTKPTSMALLEKALESVASSQSARPRSIR